jgi:DNA-binding response OmpR family regulator
MDDREIILTAVTDHEELELLTKQLGDEGYEILAAASLPELVTAIDKEGKISLAVVDMDAFDQSIWEQLDRLNDSKVPFIVLSPERSPSVQRDSLKHGASGLFTRGLELKDLVEHIHMLLGK